MSDDLARLWPDAERILDEIIDLPEPERSARAHAACAGDPALERAVGRLLRADHESRDFFENLPTRLLAEEGPGEPAPEAPDIARIGPFRVVRELGRGGMGTVYLGERDDGEFEQRVAIKFLHKGLAAGDFRETLVRERRILGRLEHPDIARIYDGGLTAAGEPYFIMEHVDGVPIDAYCDDRKLAIRERLELFRRVCRAVEYAHGRFVVHCDLKPRNILVTPGGGVKLVDFGIASLLEEEASGRTGWAVRALTPAYAAPEQERGAAVTVATDVYQLGLVLYELLTGRRARGEASSSRSGIASPSRAVSAPAATSVELSGVSSQPAETAARRGTRPSALTRELAGDLDAIAMKALRPNPSDRYATAEALRRDVEDYLDSRPVSLRASSTVYRLRKYVARHRWGVTAACAVAASLLAGLIGVAAQSRVASEERDRARLAEIRVVAVNEFVLYEMLRAPMPETSMGRELTVAEVLGNAARSVGHAFEGEPLIEAEVRLAVARTYAAIGHAAEAGLHAQAARDLLARTPGVAPVARWRADRTLSEIDVEAGHYGRSRTSLEALRGLEQESLGPADPETLRTTAALGRVWTAIGEYVRTEAMLREALSVAQAAHPESWRLLVEIERPLVNVLVLQQSGVEAERVARAMLDRLERHLGPDHPERINALTRLANALVAQLRYPEAVEVGTDAVARSRRIFGDTHPLTAEALHTEAVALERLGRYDEALAAENEAMAIARASLGDDHPKTMACLFNLAILTRNTGDPAAAEPMMRRVVEVRARVLGESNADTIRSLRSLNILLLVLGRKEDAREVARRTIRAFETAAASPDADPNLVDQFAEFLLDVRPEELQDPPRALTLAERAVQATGRRRYPPLGNLGDALARVGRTDEAIATYRELLELPDGMRSWSTEERVAELLRASRTPEDAEAFLNDRVARQRAQPRPDGRMLAKTLRLLALHHMGQGRPAEAERSFGAALENLRRVLPEGNWELGRAQSELGGCLVVRKAYAEAETLLLEGHRILAGDRQATNATAAARKRLADLYDAWGRPADAGRWR